MSARDPLWFCHECHEETRPIMVPDAQCSLCHSSFVEKIEDSNDDPREFQQHRPADFESTNLPPEFDTFLRGLVGLRHIMDQSTRFPRSPGADINADGSTPQRLRFQIRSSPLSGSRSVTIGGPNAIVPGTGNGNVPSMSQFRRENIQQHDMSITGPLMAQYLSALMSMRGGRDPFLPANDGRWGDYAFTQDALDQILTQLMENSNSSRPVPATEDVMSTLPREVLEEGSPTLQKECAVCKDQFQLETDDPGEQVVVTLPCQHPFHEDCILPWLKSSGTCPVCRHALVPQPEYNPPGPGRGTSNSIPVPPRSPRQGQDTDSLLDTMLRMSALGNSSSGGSNGGGPSSGSERGPRSRRSNESDHPHLPGSWGEQFD